MGRQRLIPTIPFDETAACREFGQVVRATRRARGWSQEDLARQVGCRKAAISDIETGKHFPHGGRFFHLCFLLDIRRLPPLGPTPSLRQAVDTYLDHLPPAQLAPLLQFLQEYRPANPGSSCHPYTSSLHCEGWVS